MDKLVISGVIGERDPQLAELLDKNGIGDNFTAEMMRDYLAQNTQGDIEIEVNTIGGDVRHGFEIYDMLQAEKAKGRKVTTYGRQFDSIGSIIFLAGNERLAYSNASPLIHNSWRSPEDLSGISLNAETLRQIADDHDEADFQMMHEYLKYAGRDKKAELQDMMRNETELTDAQLLDLNFATKILPEPAKSRAASIRAMAYASIKAEAPKHYADAILLREGQVFLVQRSINDDFEPGAWAFPGGKIEDGELPESAAARELYEETTVQALEVTPCETITNEDGSTSHYFFVPFFEMGDLELEDDELMAAQWFDIDALPDNIIKGQVDRYESLISKCVTMSEKVTALEKGLNALKARLGLIEPKAMLVPLDGGETELFVYSEDGEFEGKRAVIAEGGEPTDENAPAGTHTLRDGREITVGEGGIIESVSESPEAMYKEEMAKKEEQMAAMTEELNAAKEELKALKAAKAEADEETKAAIKAMQNEIAELKNVVPGDPDADGEKLNLKALKEQREQLKNMKPSERRLVALKTDLSK